MSLIYWGGGGPRQGCILKLKFKFRPPPLFLIYIFSPTKIYYNEWVCTAKKKLSAFFFAILYILSQLGKKYAYFYQLGGKNTHFPRFFYLISIIFSPNHIPTEKYTPLGPRKAFKNQQGGGDWKNHNKCKIFFIPKT